MTAGEAARQCRLNHGQQVDTPEPEVRSGTDLS
jgi:hypothetical protein